MAAARPAAVAPQQVAVDGGQRQALGGVSMPLGVVAHLLVGPPAGPPHPGRQPIHAHRRTGCGHFRKELAQVLQGDDEPAIGLAAPRRSMLAQ